MTELLVIAIAAATINNIVLERLLGLCPAVGFSARPAEALATGLATTAALTLTAGLGQMLHHWVLVPFGVPYLRIIALLAVAALAVQAVNRIGRRGNRHLPLLTINCAVLGVALLTTGTADGFGGALALGLGAGLGFTLVIVLFAGLRARLELPAVPGPMRGPAIALVTVGMMSLAFLGFTGLGN